MAIPKNLKKKIEAALAEVERRKLKNNYYILKPSDKLTDITTHSLVVRLTDYEEKMAETS